MGSHAKTRTTGRRTALGALAVGATLTGVGLTAAALDPATAVLSADGSTGNGASIQLSGLSTPVAFTPDSGPLGSLTAAPPAAVSSLSGPANGAVGAAPNTAGSQARTTTSHALDVSATPSSAAPATTTGSSSGTSSGSVSGSGQSAIAPIQQGIGALTGYSGKHRQIRSAAPPSDATPLAGEASSVAAAALPAVTGLAGQLPLVSDLLGGTGAGGTAAGLLDTATGTVGGTAAGPLSGLLGSAPVLGPLVGGSGDGSSTLTVPGLSVLAPLASLTPAASLLPLGG